jgi:hypothetical protein
MTTEVLGSTASATQPWIPDDNAFGARLALIRQRMGWGNVKEAATACGLPTESWRTWERDGVEPRGLLRVAKQIADRTGCDYGWLVGGSALRATPRTTTPYGTGAERPGGRHKAANGPKNRKSDGHPDPARTSRVARPGRS